MLAHAYDTSIQENERKRTGRKAKETYGASRRRGNKWG
jgi:hypothetical protein